MMKQKYGRIINMSSVVGIEGNAGQINYAASKAGIIGMTKSVAKELGSRGVTANAPGFIKTDMTDAMSDKMKDAMLDHITVKRLGEVSDIAETAAFLASDKASYITGQVIRVDGGMSL
jgi:3-oxoacyl-[acyl-carrier protein] reductase